MTAALVSTTAAVHMLVSQHKLLVAPGRYPAVLSSIYDHGLFGPDDPNRIQTWTFEVDLGHGDPVYLDALGDEEAHAHWASVLLDRPLAAPPNADEFDELTDRPCLVTVRLRRSGTGRVGQRRSERLVLPDVDCGSDPPDEHDPWVVWTSHVTDVMPLSAAI